MAQQTINIGSSANDGTGDPLRDAFDKANDNFTELYSGLGSATTLADAKAAMPPSVSFPLGNGEDPIEAGVYYIGVRVPVACTLADAHLDLDAADDDLEVAVSQASSGTPNSYSGVFALEADGAQNADDTGRSDAFSAGDRIAVEVTVAATTATQGTLTLTFARA